MVDLLLDQVLWDKVVMVEAVEAEEVEDIMEVEVVIMEVEQAEVVLLILMQQTLHIRTTIEVGVVK